MYIVHEYQTDTDGNTIVVEPCQKRSDLNEALSVFFSTCSFAAISSVPYHTVILNYHNGNQIEFRMFEHLPEETETEPEVIDNG